MTKPGARSILVTSALEEEGKYIAQASGDTGTPSEPHRGVRLLPYFDPYVVAG